MQVVIFAGWKEMFQSNCPDSLVEINSRPFIEYQIEHLKNNGINNIILCIGRYGENIRYYLNDGRDCKITLNYSENEDYKFNTGGVIKKVFQHLKDEFFIINGDAFFNINYNGIMKNFIKSNKTGMLLLNKNFNQQKSNVIVENNLVKSFRLKDLEKNMTHEYINICILKKRSLELLYGKDIFSLEQIFKALINIKYLLGYEVTSNNNEISTEQGMENFKQYLKNHPEL